MIHYALGRLVVLALATAALLAGACTGDDKPDALSPTMAPGSSAVTSPAPTRVVIDWVDFIRVGDITYLRATPGRALDSADLGPQFSTVQFNVSANVGDPSYRSKSGDAAFLDAGTSVFSVQGYAPEFRVAARRQGQLFLYEADTNPAATRGRDLLDIGGKVEYLGINSETDGKTELAAIDNPDEVAALVGLVLTAPVDQRSRDHDAQRHFIAFHLTDGTQVVRAYWLRSGELHRGIMLPPEFATAVEQR